ncbi:MAG: hypothetical protein PWP53_3271 [Lacrimispora sp.]|nr:hypothetical protein [Lacrimispora sp.]
MNTAIPSYEKAFKIQGFINNLKMNGDSLFHNRNAIK